VDKGKSCETAKKCWHCKKTGDEVSLKEIELCSDGLDIFHNPKYNFFASLLMHPILFSEVSLRDLKT